MPADQLAALPHPVIEARKAIDCLRLEAPKAVVDDVEQKVEAAFLHLHREAALPTPQRCFTLTIKVGGDTWEGIAGALDDIFDYCRHEGPKLNRVLGGPDLGFTVYCEHRPEQTHDKYFADIEAWKEQRNEQALERVKRLAETWDGYEQGLWYKRKLLAAINGESEAP